MRTHHMVTSLKDLELQRHANTPGRLRLLLDRPRRPHHIPAAARVPQVHDARLRPARRDGRREERRAADLREHGLERVAHDRHVRDDALLHARDRHDLLAHLLDRGRAREVRVEDLELREVTRGGVEVVDEVAGDPLDEGEAARLGWDGLVVERGVVLVALEAERGDGGVWEGG